MDWLSSTDLRERNEANNGSTRITIFIESVDRLCGAGLVEESGDTPKEGEGESRPDERRWFLYASVACLETEQFNGSQRKPDRRKPR